MKQEHLILILEDDIDLREALEFAFSQYDLKCVTASTVDEAISVYTTQKIEAVVCDINIPGRSGLELLNYVRQIDVALPFFLMSGSVELTPKIAMALGASGFIEKPFVDIRFVKRIKAAIVAQHDLTKNELAV